MDICTAEQFVSTLFLSTSVQQECNKKSKELMLPYNILLNPLKNTYMVEIEIVIPALLVEVLERTVSTKIHNATSD